MAAYRQQFMRERDPAVCDWPQKFAFLRYGIGCQGQADGLEPYAYLKRVFTELPKAGCVEDIEALLPFKPKIELEQAA